MNEQYFVSYVRNGRQCYGSYVGQSQETITQLLTELGATDIEYIDELPNESN